MDGDQVNMRALYIQDWWREKGGVTNSGNCSYTHIHSAGHC